MSDTIHIATRKGLFTATRNRNGWTIGEPSFYGDPVPMILRDPRDGGLYAALGHGHFGLKLHRSDDAGKTWKEITTPTYPPKPDDAPVIRDEYRGIEIPWNLEMIWSLEIDPAADGALWCGTIPGGLFHSPDRGETWELNMPLWSHDVRAKWTGGGYDYPGIHSVLVDPRDANHVALGVSVGGVWASEDHGETWHCRADGMRAEYMPPDQQFDPNVQDPHIVVRCTAQPDAMWTQHHNGIFRTTNNARSWTEIENVKPSTFGFAAAVHPNDPDTAWFVPATKDECRAPVDGRFVVTRTRDGGKTFDLLDAGLPDGKAYDIVYRHALAIDGTGDRLVIGSTTGSLWICEDQGDRWRLIATHLPPVYAVRFA